MIPLHLNPKDKHLNLLRFLRVFLVHRKQLQNYFSVQLFSKKNPSVGQEWVDISCVCSKKFKIQPAVPTGTLKLMFHRFPK